MVRFSNVRVASPMGVFVNPKETTGSAEAEDANCRQTTATAHERRSVFI
jgi:hypothetical protein